MQKMNRCQKCGAADRYSSGDCRPCAQRRALVYQKNNDRSAYKLAWAKRKRGFVKLNPEEYRQRQRAANVRWRREHSDEAKAAVAKWKRENREAVRSQIQARKARLMKASGTHVGPDRLARSAMFGDICWICEYEPKAAMDHVFALCNGGANWPANLRPICNSCNSKKARWEQQGPKTLQAIIDFKIKARDFGLKRNANVLEGKA